MLDDVLNFTRFTLDFQQVERVILLPDRQHPENDAEHSYQLALLAWHLIDKYKFKLNLSRVIQLALVHDLVETYAGDTWFYAEAEIQNTKFDRETKAREKLRQNFPEADTVHTAIDEYEALKTAESKFVYALDKIIPILNIYLDNGRSWKKDKITVDILESKKQAKVALCPELVPLFAELIATLKSNPQLFEEN